MNENWQLLNLEDSSLEKVQQALKSNNEELAFNELAQHFANRKQKGFLSSSSKEVATLFNESNTKEFFEGADNLVNQTYTYNKPWDMEKCFDPIHFENEIDWHYKYFDDPEWMFMLNRQNFLMDLVVAYLTTKKEAYLNAYVKFLNDFQTSETTFEGREGTSWRTIDTGIRLKNWVKQLEFLLPTGELSGEFILNTLGSIWKQIHYLLVDFKFTPPMSQSNWRILEFHGAYIAATFFPELKGSQEWQKDAKQRLEDILPLQVTPDGFHWEQSFMYHHEVLLNGLEAYQVGLRNGDLFTENYRQNLIHMLQASTHLTMPNYQQPAYGDSDIEDVRHIITLSALILQPKEIITYPLLKKADLPFVMDYGTTAQTDLDPYWGHLTPIETLDFEHEDSGLYFARNKWGEDGNMLFFANGFPGAGHSHSGLLHIDIVSNGEPVLVDSGRFTYKEGCPDRTYFKDARRHNTLIIDGKEFIEQDGSWGFGHLADQVKRPVKLNRDIDFLQSAHLGYGPEAFVNRKIIYFKEDNMYILFDEIDTTGTHNYQQHFRFLDDRIALHENKATYQTAKNHFSFYPLDGQEMDVEDTQISPDYNRKIDTKELIMNGKDTGTTHLGVLLVDESKKEVKIEKIPVTSMGGRPLDTRYYSGYHIKTKDNEYLVMAMHFEKPESSRQIRVMEDVPFFGKTVVCKKEGEKFIPIVLEN